MTNIEGSLADDADLTISIDRGNLVNTMMGAIGLDDQIKTGNANLEGNHGVYQQL